MYQASASWCPITHKWKLLISYHEDCGSILSIPSLSDCVPSQWRRQWYSWSLQLKHQIHTFVMAHKAQMVQIMYVHLDICTITLHWIQLAQYGPEQSSHNFNSEIFYNFTELWNRICSGEEALGWMHVQVLHNVFKDSSCYINVMSSADDVVFLSWHDGTW